MSSLAATQADSFYRPPEWRPEYGGLSAFQGSKGSNQYETHGIIRFELPFDAWCLKCNRHMSKGLRFNAKKEKANEKYFSTQIWSFSMKCPEIGCDQHFIIKTDPQNDTYNMAEGLRKMEQEFTPEYNDSIITATTDEQRNLLLSDPIYRLQHAKEDRLKSLSAKEHLESLIELQSIQKEKDYDMNSLLRNGNREKRKRAIFLLEEGNKRGLPLPLVEESADDYNTAKSIKFASRNKNYAISERNKIMSLQNQSIFSDDKVKRKNCSSSSKEANKKQQINNAMNKQAIVNINTTKLRIKDLAPVLSSSQSSHQNITSTKINTKNRITTEENNNNNNTNSNTTKSGNKALSMLSIYDNDSDSN